MNTPVKNQPINDSLKTELHWRQLTQHHATEVVISSPDGRKYFDIGESTQNRIVVTLPNGFIPIEFTWPVQNCIVALVETGCYERTLIETCKRSGAIYIECYSRTTLEPYVVLMDYAARLTA